MLDHPSEKNNLLMHFQNLVSRGSHSIEITVLYLLLSLWIVLHCYGQGIGETSSLPALPRPALPAQAAGHSCASGQSNNNGTACCPQITCMAWLSTQPIQ